ncbi:hypothetical protein DSCW_02670 [Desulfosarcina widdelii]|uniref:EamA domain-containing protein n=1 Tax=Desulfosarcina widdelii TaxID=947919 RepID=A0A5K7YX01_9BACT|nr:DMT family transporter [Desulfosarcina widdelii]BBO72850.1 hypothetical protein DSCW_02670 [Desulfosarcina widdelii]
MNETAIFLVLLSAAMHALRNFLTKKALDKQSFIWWYETFGLIFFTPVFVWVLVSEGMGVLIFSKMILISGVLHVLYWVFLAKSLENGDLSLVYPIMRSSPALVLVFSIAVLGERVSTTGIAGILLVAVGVYTIGMNRFSLAELIRPMRAVRSDRATRFALLTLVMVAAYSLADKIAVEEMHPVVFAYLYPWVSMALFSLYLGNTKWSGGAFIREWDCNKTGILLCGVLSIFGYFLILAAFTLERVSYIVGLRQLSIVFAVLLGGHFLKEENRLVRIVSSVVIFLGAYLIAVAD